MFLIHLGRGKRNTQNASMMGRPQVSLRASSSDGSTKMAGPVVGEGIKGSTNTKMTASPDSLPHSN